MEENNLKMPVWYVCYGSNLLWSRFERYIIGGKCGENGKEYDGCTDKTLPSENVKVELPYELYFAKESPSWNGMGVAFLNIKKKDKTQGRAYLINQGQLNDIHKQEGKAWYDNMFHLGTIDDISAFTLTSSKKYGENAPSDKYQDTINRGLKELEELETKELKG